MIDETERKLSRRRRRFKLTPYRLAVLGTLRMHPSTSASAGDSPAHFEAACRVMEQNGLVARNLHDVWRLRPAGEQALEEAGR